MARVGVPGVWVKQVLKLSKTGPKYSHMALKLSKTGPKYCKFSKTGTKFSKMRLVPGNVPVSNGCQNVPSFLIDTNVMRFPRLRLYHGLGY